MHYLLGARRYVEKAMDILSIVLFLALFAVVLVQIFFRYVLSSPLVWSEELSRIMYIWACLIGWTLAARHGSHIRVGFFLEKFPAPVRKALDILFALCGLFFMGLLTWLGMRMMGRVYYVSAVTVPISNALIYAALPLSALVCLYYQLMDVLALAGILPRPATDAKGE